MPHESFGFEKTLFPIINLSNMTNSPNDSDLITLFCIFKFIKLTQIITCM
jgi:hypothetical protein